MSTSVETSDHSFAIVTPTCLPDLKRFELLAESLDRTAPNVTHYFIVDRCDRSAFSHLNRGRRRLIESEELLGNWIVRMRGRKGLWFSLKTLPVRGWIIQQLLKIGSADVIQERTLVFCDSDTAFIRRFERNDLLIDGKIGLLDVDFANHDIRQWTATGRRLLGVSHYNGGYRNHVGNVICWNRETVKAMRRRIENSTGMNWQIALARTFSFSEYMIYGVFVREVKGYAEVDHAPSEVPLAKPSWGTALRTDSEINAFFADFDRRTIAVMIHSKDKLDPERYRYHLERCWDAAD